MSGRQPGAPTRPPHPSPWTSDVPRTADKALLHARNRDPHQMRRRIRWEYRDSPPSPDEAVIARNSSKRASRRAIIGDSPSRSMSAGLAGSVYLCPPEPGIVDLT